MGWLLDSLNAAKQVENARPWPRAVVDEARWNAIVDAVAAGDGDLLSLWGDGANVHLAVMDRVAREIGVVTFECPEHRFPSVAAKHPPAQRLERTILDIYGLQPVGAIDQRPWLDHGRWPVLHPGGQQEARESTPIDYEFLPAGGAPLHQIPVGPVHAGIIEPGHFRFSANGETVVRLEERLGYVHKGVESLMRRKPIDGAAKIAARISGDSTVAYSLAFALAVEAAVGVEASPRAQKLRGVMAELERIANHLGDVGAICNDASFSIIQAHCHILRERVLRASQVCFGHRLMMDRIAPGGVTTDLASDGREILTALLAEVATSFGHICTVYDNANSIQDRTVGTGLLSRNLAEQFFCGGVIGRASGRDFDARRWPGYAPYANASFDVVIRTAGDVDARVWVRIDEIAQSAKLIADLLGDLSAGPVRAPIEARGASSHDGFALVESFRGDIFAHVRVGADGLIEHAHLRDPSWFQWPLLEAAIEGNIVADFPLCNKSFNCSYSGHDL